MSALRLNPICAVQLGMSALLKRYDALFRLCLMSYRFSRFRPILKPPVRQCRTFGSRVVPWETIIRRTRKDDSKAFTAQIVIKKGTQ